MPAHSSKVVKDLIGSCVTLPIGFKAGTGGDLAARCYILLCSFKASSEALRKLALPFLPAEVELPSRTYFYSHSC